VAAKAEQSLAEGESYETLGRLISRLGQETKVQLALRAQVLDDLDREDGGGS